MNERERAQRLAAELDRRLQGSRGTEEPHAPENPAVDGVDGDRPDSDRPLLKLADRLLTRAPFAPTTVEQAQLRRRLERLNSSMRQSTMQKTFSKLLKPAVQTTLWGALLLGILALAVVLIANFLGSPVRPAAGPDATEPAQPSPSAAPAEPTPTPLPAPGAGFEPRFQTVKEIHMELREVARIGESLRVTLCYNPPENRSTRMEDVQLKAGDTVQTLYPSSLTLPVAGPQGPACETFTGAVPDAASGEPWTITLPFLSARRNGQPDCEQVARQLGEDYPDLSIQCPKEGDSFGYMMSHVPDGMDDQEASQIARTYMETAVTRGPWWFEIDPADAIPLAPTGGPANPVIVPSACDANSPLFSDPVAESYLHFRGKPAGFAGGGSLQSGEFTFLLGLPCGPGFNRLELGGIRSEINGLGLFSTVSYAGQPVEGQIEYASGIVPFVTDSNESDRLDSSTWLGSYLGLEVPEAVLPDFTRSDVRLRYLARVRTPSGVEGAALTFTLQRAPEGYRPVDVQVEPLSETERQSFTSDRSAWINEPLPFPTLPAPVKEISAETQALLRLLERWQEPLLSAPGWVHLRTFSEDPNGNDLYAGLTEYQNDDWYEINAQRKVVTHIHVDARLDGQVLQQAYSQNGKSVNLTFGSTDEFTPYPLDLAYSVRSILQEEAMIRTETTIDGKAAILLTLPGIFIRREAVDAASGAWLYTETVAGKEGDDPTSGGTLETRTTLQVAERVDAPPADVLALLGQEFSGYTPPEPFGTPAPQSFDPSQSQLTLQTVHGDDFNQPSFWYGDLYAGGYLLGRVDFGATPGGYACDRSAGGGKYAFIYSVSQTDGLVTSQTLRWFDLRAPEVVHQPAPELSNLEALSWSPVEEKLALFGCDAERQHCGLYVLDPATDQAQRLMSGISTQWPILWSPDGSQIAFINTLGANTLYVVDFKTGKVLYQGPFDANAWQVPDDSPTLTWGVDFPRSRDGSICLNPK